MATLVRGYIEYGPYNDNALFGAPYVLNTGWSSTGNDVHVWILTALGLLTGDPFTVLALYFFLTFPASALTMYWLCRRYYIARPAAVMAGVLFSVIPGHQERFPHLFLAAYWAVPFAAWLIIETAQGRSVLNGSPAKAGLRRVAHYGVPVLMLVSIGLGDVYYVAFTLVVVAPILLMRQMRRIDLRELARLSLPLVVMVAPTLVSIAAARRRADRDLLTGSMPFGRTFLDSNRWAGQLIDLVLPWPGHRVPNLGARTEAYDALTGTTGEVSAIGVVAVIGLVALVAVASSSLLRGGPSSLPPLLGALFVASLISLGFFARGGLGALTAFLVTPQIRTWSRLFLFIGLFALLAMAWFVTRLRARAGGRRRMVAVSALLLVVGVLDQTNPGRAPDYTGNSAYLAILKDFDDRVQQNLGDGCDVFVLPVVGFPEVNDDLWSDLMSLGLASNDLHWSFGAIKGTAQADWQLGLSSTDPQRMVEDLASVGFCGVVVESSFTQRSPTLATQIPRLLGGAVATSSDQRFAAYRLEGVRKEIESRLGSAGVAARAEAALHPVIGTLAGAWAMDEAAGRRFPLGPGPSISLSNMSGKDVAIRLDLTLVAGADTGVTLRLEAPGTRSEPLTLTPSGRGSLSLTVTAPPGMSSVAIVTTEEETDWTAFSDKSRLPSVQTMTVASVDPAVNVGTGLPTP
ncbi:hypothetical protein ACXR8F_07920 [Terrabacter sp. AAH1]